MKDVLVETRSAKDESPGRDVVFEGREAGEVVQVASASTRLLIRRARCWNEGEEPHRERWIDVRNASG